MCKAASKTAEPRSRVSLSANYEKQIEQINDRLAGIEDTLYAFRLNASKHTPSSVSGKESVLPNSATDSIHTVASRTAFEGASSFTNQAVQASQAAGLSLESLSGSLDAADALASLAGGSRATGVNVGIRQNMRLGTSASMASKALPDIPLLPAQFVLDLLQLFREKQACLYLVFCVRDHRQLEKMCQRIYFPTETVSVASVTAMHGLLLYMIKDLLQAETPVFCTIEELQQHHDQAELNFHTGMETYELLAFPSLDSAKALMVAMMKAQDEGKPLLAWMFCSTGVRHIVSLGFHREASLRLDPHEVAEDKRQIFWTFYMADKNLSLTLGYNSTLQDNDIDVAYFRCSSDPGIRPWDKAAFAMIDIVSGFNLPWTGRSKL